MLKLSARARRAARVVVGCYTVTGPSANERPLSPGQQPWCGASAVASNAELAPRVLRCSGAPTLAVSGAEAQH